MIEDSMYPEPPQNELCHECGEWLEECTCDKHDDELYREELRAGLIA